MLSRWGSAGAFGGWRWLALVHHADCGFERLATPELATGKRLGVPHPHIGCLANVSIRHGIDRLQCSPKVPKELVVSGHIHRVEDSTIDEVVPRTALVDL